MIITRSTFSLILLDSFLGKHQMQTERFTVDLQIKNAVGKIPKRLLSCQKYKFDSEMHY